QEEAPFNPSMMTHFRKRLDADMINQLNEAIVMEELAGQSREDDDDQDDDSDDNDDPPSENTSSESADTQSDDQPANQGKLLLDATCTPADIAYPTDLGLLNEAREKLEHIIDVLHAPHRGKKKKPRTYRQKARKAYLSVAKQRKPKAKKMRKAIGKQLGFVERDLKIVSSLKEESSVSLWTRRGYRRLRDIREGCGQQRDMDVERSERIDDRIVSIPRRRVRPIVSGEAKAGTGFGAKVSGSLVDGYALMENLDWQNYN